MIATTTTERKSKVVVRFIAAGSNISREKGEKKTTGHFFSARIEDRKKGMDLIIRVALSLILTAGVTAWICASILGEKDRGERRRGREDFTENGGLNAEGTALTCSNLKGTLKRAVPICGLDLTGVGLPPKIMVNSLQTTEGDVHAKGDLTADGDLDVRNPGGKRANHDGGRFRTFYENGNTHVSLEEFDGEVSYDLKTHKDGGDLARLVKTHNGDVYLTNNAGHRLRLAKDGGVHVEGGNARVCVDGECLGAEDIRDIREMTSTYVSPEDMEDRFESLVEEEADKRKDRFKELNAKILQGVKAAIENSSKKTEPAAPSESRSEPKTISREYSKEPWVIWTHEGQDLPGNPKVGTLQDCKGICDEDPQCVGFSRQQNMLDAGNGQCWFKKDVSRRHRSSSSQWDTFVKQ